MKDNKGLRWNNRREEAVLCEPSDRQHKIDWWFCCIKNWWFESALSGSDLSFPHFASQSSWLFRSQPVQCEPSDRQHATDGRSVRPKRRFWPTVRPTVRLFPVSRVASPVLWSEPDKSEKVVVRSWGCLDYQRDYRAVQIIVRTGNISKWPSVFGKPSGF